MHNIIEGMIGKVFTSVEASENSLLFKAANGETFEFMHEQECCEWVRIYDICGDLSDLENSPILMAEEVSGDSPSDIEYTDDYHTWTFYKFATIKGYVDVRWLGESNGYYSERVHMVYKEGNCN
jgi:hypothetical protein